MTWSHDDGKEFWHDGLQFECQKSGRCCTHHGKYAYVYLRPQERARLAESLHLEVAAFTREYCETTDGYLHLKSQDDDCVFLEAGRCRVYAARPIQCRAWPFCLENMNAEVWQHEIASICPGVGKGRRVLADEIETLLRAAAAPPERL